MSTVAALWSMFEVVAEALAALVPPDDMRKSLDKSIAKATRAAAEAALAARFPDDKPPEG